MNPNLEEALFALAVDKSAAERAAFLDHECGADAALRQRLDALLAAHEASAGVLADEPDREVLAPTLDLPEPVADEAVGMTLGRYKLREKLGEGGCGTVYVAEQTEPVRRRVALKLWDVVTRTNLATMRGLSACHSLTFAPNSRRIVTGHSSSQQTLNSVYLWDVVTHRNVLGLPGQGRGFHFVQFSPDGHALMAINEVGLLHLWRAPSWAEIAAAEKAEAK